jgi:hypothetical protein
VQAFEYNRFERLEPPGPARQPKLEKLTFSLRPDELTLLRAFAADAGLSEGGLIRRWLHEANGAKQGPSR